MLCSFGTESVNSPLCIVSHLCGGDTYIYVYVAAASLSRLPGFCFTGTELVFLEPSTWLFAVQSVHFWTPCYFHSSG